MDHSGQRELETALDNLERLANEDGVALRKKVYDTFSGISFLILEAKKSNFKKGWASNTMDRHGEPMFDRDEASILEEAVQKFIKPLFHINSKKVGGNLSVKPSATGQIVKSKLNPEDLSIDKTFWRVRDMIRSIDDQVKSFSRELGPFRFFYDKNTPDFRFPLPIPAPPPVFVSVIMVPVNPRAIPIVIGLIIEAIRITTSIGPSSNDMTRKFLSLALGLIDFLKGDWKQGILSIVGFFGEVPMVAGLIGKVLLNLLDLIAPDIQERLTMDIYQSGKSVIIGFLLWGFANFAPDFVRISVRTQFDAIKKVVEDTNGKIDDIEAAMQKSVEPAGLELKMKDIPEGFVPTFDDIQNLQAIVRQPTIYCSKEFQEATEPLRKIPPMRLILELMSIPTDPQTLAFECKDSAGESIEKTVDTLLTPEITPKTGSPIADALSGDIPNLTNPQIPSMPNISNPANSELPGISNTTTIPKNIQKIQRPKKTENRRWRRGGTRRKK